MKLKTLLAMTVSAGILAACTAPQQAQAPASKKLPPIEFKEPQLSPAFFPYNAVDYTQPSEFEVNLYKASAAPVTPMRVKADPTNPDSHDVVLEQNRIIIPLTDSRQPAVKYAVIAQGDELDVTDLDDFLNLLEGKARHYPVHFGSSREKDGFSNKLKDLVNNTLNPLADNPKASYDVLVRALKANTMARNLDLGDKYGPKTLEYAKRILAMQPKDPTANFWLGFALTEGGGFKEGLPYLQTAMKAGVQEAYLSAANTYLFMEQRKNAINTLKNYAKAYPSEATVINGLIKDIQAGKRYNVWQTAMKK